MPQVTIVVGGSTPGVMVDEMGVPGWGGRVVAETDGAANCDLDRDAALVQAEAAIAIRPTDKRVVDRFPQV